MVRRRLAALALPLVLPLAGAGCGARTGLADEPYTTPVLYCPEAAYAARPGSPTLVYAGVPRYARGRARWEVVRGPPGGNATLSHDGDGAATFLATVEGTYGLRVTVPAPGTTQDGGAAPSSCELTVRVQARGPLVVCPDAIDTAPLRPVDVAARVQSDRRITSRRWTLEGAPGASGLPRPRPDDEDATRFTPDVAGDYRLQFTATDEADESASCTTLVRARPTEGVRVELFWNPPGRTCPAAPGAACDRSDVDLHVLRGSRGAGWSTRDDCNWQNCNASRGLALAWDTAGAGDDPRLDIDDVDGHGPENVNLDRPTNRSYRVGVHYYADHDASDQAAHVLVYCSGAAVARFGPVVLRDRGDGPEGNDFWMVADVLPTADGGCTVRPITRAGAPYVVSWAEAQRDPGPPAP